MRSLLLALALVAPSMARAGEPPPGPICGRPQVLELLQERLAQAGRPLVIEAGNIGERPGARPEQVLCAVRAHRLGYDTPRYGATPVDEVSVVHYALELRRHGIFLRLR